MNKRVKNKKSNKVGFLTLNRQFCIVIIIGIFISYLTLILAFLVFEPLINMINPWFIKINDALPSIKQELYKLSEDPSWSIGDRNKLPEIDKIMEEYPRYQINYEIYPGIDRKAFEVKGLLSSSTVNAESYASIVLEASDAVIVVGVNTPELVRLGMVVNVVIILFFIIILLLFIGFFVSRKVRYLKSITRSLEYIAGGDLNIRIPIKGRDEVSQVAWHINEMTATLSNELQKEKETEETKNQLLTNISHDLRTPLTAVVGFLNVLETMDIGTDTDKVKQYIHRAYEKSENLSHLVDQLFDYVLLSNQQTVFHFTEAEPSVFFMQAFIELEDLLNTQEIQVFSSFKGSGRNIKIDCSRMKRVIENLVQNILKYAKNSSIVTVEGNEQDNYYVLQVTNEAKEVLSDSSAYLNRYFTTDRASGKSAGLGLAICRELIEQQQGEFIISADQFCFKTMIRLPLIT